MSLWHRHPGVRTGSALTPGERAADRMRNSMGSWAFVGVSLAFLASWMAANVFVLRERGHTFDPYPFILLNLILSCVAALQGAILLIAAKRSDQVSSELAQHDYEADVESRELLTAQAQQLSTLTDLVSSLHSRFDAEARRATTIPTLPEQQEGGPLP